jgi:GTP-dependent dephospho-CoA kinase
VKSGPFISLLRASPFVVTVGDRVTETMQELGRTPDVQIIDEVERRVRRQAPDVPYVKLFKASNPAGTITQEAILAIEGAFAGEKPARVLVDGEEDLLVIPTIVSAPAGSTLFYGQPGKGVVLVVVDERAKASSRLLMSSMRSARRSTGSISS